MIFTTKRTFLNQCTTYIKTAKTQKKCRIGFKGTYTRLIGFCGLWLRVDTLCKNAERKILSLQSGQTLEKYYRLRTLNDDVRFIVTGSNVLPKFCPNCGSKITTKPKMCELAGVEFPVPVKWEDRANGNWLVDTSRNEIAVIHCCGNFYNHYINNRVQKTREAAHQQLKAEVAALKQAIEEAK